MQMRDYKNRLKEMKDERDEPSLWETIAAGSVAATVAILIILVSMMLGA
jgi:hypothetical protein